MLILAVTSPSRETGSTARWQNRENWRGIDLYCSVLHCAVSHHCCPTGVARSVRTVPLTGGCGAFIRVKGSHFTAATLFILHWSTSAFSYQTIQKFSAHHHGMTIHTQWEQIAAKDTSLLTPSSATQRIRRLQGLPESSSTPPYAPEERSTVRLMHNYHIHDLKTKVLISSSYSDTDHSDCEQCFSQT